MVISVVPLITVCSKDFMMPCPDSLKDNICHVDSTDNDSTDTDSTDTDNTDTDLSATQTTHV